MDLDELIIRSLQGRVSSPEARHLWEWRQADPHHEKRYQELAAVWRATREYEGPLVTSAPALEDLTSEEALPPRGSRRWQRMLRPIGAVAASFTVGLGLASLLEVSGPLVDEAAAEIVTGIGETATTRLPDGTVVRLAPESRLLLPGPDNDRDVTLDGQAFFAVSTNTDRPFTVRTPTGEARVLGTRFELNARGGQLRLLVVEGRVAVTSGETEVAVGAREMTHLREGDEPSTVEVEDVWALLNWMGDFMAFESTPLREVRTELERRFDVTLIFDAATLPEETVTVWFQGESIGEVVAVLCRLVEARCTMEGSRVRMTRAAHTP